MISFILFMLIYFVQVNVNCLLFARFYFCDINEDDLFTNIKRCYNFLFMHFTQKRRHSNGPFANIKCRESVPVKGIAKLKRHKQKTVYSIGEDFIFTS